MKAIAILFVAHWVLSVFFQTFFQHRYAAHRMFTMSKGWERFFYISAYVFMGPSFLVPRAYAVLHRMHHAYSDTPKDPHSPNNHKGLFDMMWHTRKTYHDLAHEIVQPEAKFDGGYPQWKAVDRLSQSWFMRIAYGALFVGFYLHFATAWWQLLLIPAHWLMGPIHGAIVNWCGHRYGYKNFDNGDDSRNTIPFDFITMGELFQNNHHKFGMSPNFAARAWELDPTYQIMRLFHFLGIIDLGERPQLARMPEASTTN
ncbi:MAG: acyl-CoA desaturase [Polyangiales bacterium]